MSLEQIWKNSRRGNDDPHREMDRYGPTLFEKRVAVQGFLKGNEYLISFFLSDESVLAENHPDPRMRTLESASAYCLDLSQRIAMACTGKNRASNAEIKIFRYHVAQQVVRHIRTGELIDERRMIDVFRKVAELADPAFDTNPFAEFKMDDHVRWHLTLGSVSARLMRTVEKYTFRQPVAEVTEKLSLQVLERAAKTAVELMETRHLDLDNRMSLIQTVSQNLSHIMVRTYNTVARQALSELLRMPEEERVEWLEKANCLGRISAEFEEKAREYQRIVKSSYQHDVVRLLPEQQAASDSRPQPIGHQSS